MKNKLLLCAFILCWLVGPTIFLLGEIRMGVMGFPLDDSWIHQTYARSLAAGQGWSYGGGLPSAGSTSPAWTMLQVPAYWLQISPVIWSYLLGILLLLMNASLVFLWSRTIVPKAAPFAFVFALGEWHLVWAGVSGMETILFCCWLSAVIYFVNRMQRTESNHHPFPLVLGGFVIGVGLWIRPESILMSGIAILVLVCAWGKNRFRSDSFLILGSGLAFMSYFAFELALHGRIWPNTFYAKPAEYIALTSSSLLIRLSQPWMSLLAGPFAVLWIFLIAFIVIQFHRQSWRNLWPLLWVISHLVIFSIQLPATYQHGRYFMPILPILMGLGVCGYFLLEDRLGNFVIPRILMRAGWSSAILLTLIFLWLGANQYGMDVGVIQSEMVYSAEWIRDHTPPQAIIAAHDIGALGFWGNRSIVDLGGLTDLDALNLLSGRETLNEYLTSKRVNYLLTFPGLYPVDLKECTPLMQTKSYFSPSMGGENMAVYRWGEGCRTP